MGEELLTIKEIARRLDLPESNIRYYRDRFEEYLPYVGQGRKRRYKKEALEVFGAIVEGLRSNMTSEEIGKQLSRSYPRTMVVEQEERQASGNEPVVRTDGSSLAEMMRSQSKVLERLADALYVQSSRQGELDEVKNVQWTLKKGLKLLWNDYRKVRGSIACNDGERLSQLEGDIEDLERELKETKQEYLERIALLERQNQELKERFHKLHTVLERVAETLSHHPDLTGD